MWPASCAPVFRETTRSPISAIVSNVRIGHHHIVAAYARDVAALVRAAIHRGEFAEFVRVARFEPGALTVEGKILGVAA